MSSISSHLRALHVGALVSLVVTACVPPAPTSGATRVVRSPSEIHPAEIEAALGRLETAYDIVSTLRPGMLVSRDIKDRPRSGTATWSGTFGIKVYLDGIRYGGVESLATIPANTVLEVRWLSALDATTRYGTGHSAGVVSVTSRTGRR